MATLNVRVRKRWWVEPYIRAAIIAAKAVVVLRIANPEDLDEWIDREARFIADRGFWIEVA